MAPSQARRSAPEELRERYLELLIAAITHTLYRPIDVRPLPPEIERQWQAAIEEEAQRTGKPFVLPPPEREREEGRDRPLYAQTMIGLKRMRNLRDAVESVIAEGVGGDLIEAGVWRGGASILMRGVLAAHDEPDRRVFVADSFQGLPEPDAERYPLDAADLNYAEEELAVGVDEVRANFERYGLLDDRVRFLEGWFRDTLPALAAETFAVVRLDGDLYESTMDGLVNLYPRLAVGGYLIVDDYGFENSRAAVEDYRREHGISEPIELVDWVGAYWRRRE